MGTSNGSIVVRDGAIKGNTRGGKTFNVVPDDDRCGLGGDTFLKFRWNVRPKPSRLVGYASNSRGKRLNNHIPLILCIHLVLLLKYRSTRL